MSTPIRVGVIGLGIIGSRVAKNLRTKGFDVYVWNRTPKSEPNFVSSPAEVAKAAQIIQIFVSNDAAVLETLAALRTELTPNHLILIHSTISPETVQKARDVVTSTGAHLVDAPFPQPLDRFLVSQIVGKSKCVHPRSHAILGRFVAKFDDFLDHLRFRPMQFAFFLPDLHQGLEFFVTQPRADL